MPRNLPHYTECAAPGVAHPWSNGGNWLAVILGSAFLGGVWGVAVTGIVAEIVGVISLAGCAIGSGIGFFVTFGILQFKHWYYNERLMCISKDQCAAGTLVGHPHDAFDGDRKLDIHLAPFNVRDSEQRMIEQLDAMRGTLPNVPDVVDLQNRQILFGYLKGLSDSQEKEVYIRLIDERLFTSPANSFQRHYWRRDETIMGTPAFNAAPDDTLAAADPNPLFRLNAEEAGDPEENVIVPWMHCEVEGNRLAKFLDNILAAVLAFIAIFLALCVVCDVLTLGIADWLCGLIAGGIAAILAFLVWLIANWINDPDDGVAGDIDLDVEDPDFDTPPSEAQPGDVIYLFGDWIMDTEHDNYFEIHPVKAYYLLCRGRDDVEDWVLTEEVAAADCEFDVRNVTSELMERLCKVVTAAENTDPDDKLTVEIQRGMSMMTTGR